MDRERTPLQRLFDARQSVPTEKRAEMEKVQEEQKKLRAQATALRRKADALKREVEAKWSKEYAARSAALDAAIIEELRTTGRSGSSILEELGSKHSHWITDLKAKARTIELRESIVEDPREGLAKVEWQFHDHTPTHGWLVSTDRNFLKHYSDDGRWFVLDTSDYGFVAGNRELWEQTPRDECAEKLGILERLLNGTFKERKQLSPNPYRW